MANVKSNVSSIKVGAMLKKWFDLIMYFTALLSYMGNHLMLWSQIIYGHHTASITSKLVRFYGARPAAGRIVRFGSIFKIPYGAR